jgi:hypothetical protein
VVVVVMRTESISFDSKLVTEATVYHVLLAVGAIKKVGTGVKAALEGKSIAKAVTAAPAPE